MAIKVLPRSRRPGLRGSVPSGDGPRLGIGVNEPPENGRANGAACALLAQALGLPRSAVTIVAGASSREKLLHISGDPARLVARLEAL